MKLIKSEIQAVCFKQSHTPKQFNRLLNINKLPWFVTSYQPRPKDILLPTLNSRGGKYDHCKTTQALRVRFGVMEQKSFQREALAMPLDGLFQFRDGPGAEPQIYPPLNFPEFLYLCYDMSLSVLAL